MSLPDLRRPRAINDYRPLSYPSSVLATSTSVPSTRRIASFASYGTSSTPSLSALDSPYLGVGRPLLLGHEYALSADPQEWGTDLSPDLVEADDILHTPDPADSDKTRIDKHAISWRGLINVGTLVVIVFSLLMLFAGYPIFTYYSSSHSSTLGAFNLGGINASGQVPRIPGNFGLIDLDTPQSAHSKPSWQDGKDWDLVFSDEFNMDGRTFWPGDDPYWEAVNLHYWETNNLEWYDPAAITTQGGDLVITLSQKDTHNLQYQGGMMSTWNKFCFTGGYIEANVSLPGLNNVLGLWPAIWTMGNLGRAGYGASLEGMWPYSYDACDVGTAPNQTHNGQPVAATVNGDPGHDGVLSFLPGQKLSRCTCPGESHPGPKHSDGSFVGRSAPEIDMFEAQITGTVSQVSQSAQWAPFNAGYIWLNTTQNEIIADPSISQQNTMLYITWISNDKVSWTLNISARPVSQEPMYVIANLGMSYNFGNVDLAHIPFPVHLRVDYIRHNVGCDPENFPTAAYINEYYSEAYTNPNLTTWRDDFGQPFPKSSFLGQC
ncbi:beta-glucan synthesis-associated [Amylocystis lapponica]|nr:beta-glucan synthesis-associated [Amylocystis lapponica]